MNILVVNDDGPPSRHASPYVHSLVRQLQREGHRVSVCLPHTQRSWIGKAHIIGQTVEPTYYRPPGPMATPAGLTPAEGEDPDNGGSVHERPWSESSTDSASSASTTPPEEWVLVNGTPASCVQIGLHHVFRQRGPFDLVVSGPNYGRNTTAVFALSSGTLGGALEAAACGVRAVALSYAFFRRGTDHDPEVVAEASRHAVRVIAALARQWPADGSVDLYSVNVPLVAGVAANRTVWAPVLQNYWRRSACFVEVPPATAATAGAAADARDIDGEAAQAEEKLREGDGGEASPAGSRTASTAAADSADTTTTTTTTTSSLKHSHYKWQPRFDDVFQSVEDAPPGNDGWAVREGFTSVSPLKANFFQAATQLHGTEFQLDDPQPEPTTTAAAVAATAGAPDQDPLYALIAYDDPYVQPILLDALRAAVPPGCRLQLLAAAPTTTDDEPTSLEASLAAAVPGLNTSASASTSTSLPRILQVAAYEAIDFEYAAAHPQSALINSYVFRKALIRKHFLASTVEHWVAKRPASVLARHVRRTESFEVDYAEFLDDALVEAFDLRASLDANADLPADQRAWWILKPSMSDRGQGIRLFSTMEELQAIFDGWEEGDDEDDSDSDSDNKDKDEDYDHDHDHDDNITASDLRHFVAQPYIHPPLLLPGTDGRKFHIRVYVLCVGALQVYVCRDMLALFAATPYQPPWVVDDADGDAGSDANDADRLARHLTNTCLQDEADKGDSVRRFWDLDGGNNNTTTTTTDHGSPSSLNAIFDQICQVTGELFEAAAVGMPIHFQPMPHAFEVYGLDFLVEDGSGNGNSSSNSSSTSSPTPTAHLLEVNAFPDFRQTGSGLQSIVAQFWADSLRLVVRRFLGQQGTGTGDNLGHLVLVKDLDLGRR